jgi:ribosomal protein S27AE
MSTHEIRRAPRPEVTAYQCPRCNKQDIIPGPAQRVHCGDCLMEYVEIVLMVPIAYQAPN